MGFAIAEAFNARGARVELVTGPVNLMTPASSVHLTAVQTAEEMFEAVMRYAPQADVIVMTAAVADFTPASPVDHKIKKLGKELEIKLKPTKDILKVLGQKKAKNQLLVGFALETDNELENAGKKLKNKNLDLIVLNSLKDEGAGFGHSTNKVKIIDRMGAITEYGLKDKIEVAGDLLDRIAQLLQAN